MNNFFFFFFSLEMCVRNSQCMKTSKKVEGH